MTEDWLALARAVTARRTRLALAKDQLVTRGGPTAATLRLIEAGRGGNFHEQTYGRLERALKWRVGTCAALLGGQLCPHQAVGAAAEDTVALEIISAVEAARRAVLAIQPASDLTVRAARALQKLVAQVQEQAPGPENRRLR
ncbi:hypothetical protein [Pseudonocardia ailaonensis]